MNTENEDRGRRVTIDLTPAAAQEVDRLRELTGLTTADMFRNAFSLFRLYVQAREQGQDLCVVDPRDDNAIRTRLELPVVVPPATSGKREARPNALSKGANK